MIFCLLHFNYDKHFEQIFLKTQTDVFLTNLKSCRSSQKLHKCHSSDILYTLIFFHINVRIIQIMVFIFVSSPFAFKGSERKIDCSTKTKQIPPVIFLSKHRLLTPERHAKSQRRIFGVINQPVKSSTYFRR